MAEKDLGLSLFDTLKNSDLTEIAADFGELMLDEGLSNDLVKDIPILSTLRNLYNVTTSISNYLFTKKVLKFLKGLADIPLKEREKLIERMATDEKDAHQVGETLILLLDRMNDMQKPDMLAKSFRAYIQGVLPRLKLDKSPRN
jgi:hypothetical protein